jgi:predicted metal-dependent HD superfamily phosphohydrolase
MNIAESTTTAAPIETMTPENAEKTIERHVENYVRELLTHHLSPQYMFHNLQHTVEVTEMAQEIGVHLGLTAEQMNVLTIAGWFHDAGYTETYVGHEAAGAEIAQRFLREHGYPQTRIDEVMSCIMATKMPQMPKNLTEQALCDADVANLGMEAFLEKTERLREELEATLDMHFADEEWYVSSLNFCKNHHFHTNYARLQFSEQQAANAEWIELFSQYKEHKEAVNVINQLI